MLPIDLTSSVMTPPATVTSNRLSTTQQAGLFFVPPTCSPPTEIGADCNISRASCASLQSCQNNATCQSTNSTARGYTCRCSTDFTGDECQYPSQLCQVNPCWNYGKPLTPSPSAIRLRIGMCNQTSNTTFYCQCRAGWRGMRCEAKINYCDASSCLNRGVCQPLLLNYTCRCLTGSYTGVRCQIETDRVLLLQRVAKSFAYIAIIAIVSVVVFVITMDVLKYGFNIDPVHAERPRRRRRRGKPWAKPKRPKPPVPVRFIYVNRVA